MLWRHLNFRKISYRFSSSFVNPSFQYLNGSHIMYQNMIILNPSGFKVEPHSKYWYFCIERWDLPLLRFSENAVLFHIEWVCRKTEGNVNRPPYRYTAVTHWACPPSSASPQMQTIFWVLIQLVSIFNWFQDAHNYFSKKKRNDNFVIQHKTQFQYGHSIVPLSFNSKQFYNTINGIVCTVSF